MASSSISGLTRNATRGVKQSIGSSSSGESPVRNSQGGRGRNSNGGTDSSNGSGSRQFINVDGVIFNRNARRGTYLNILV